MLKFLIDECLSPDLVGLAHGADCGATSVRDLGLLGTPDHRLISIILENDYIFVTLNARDFRSDNPQNSVSLYDTLEMHSGLICIISSQNLLVHEQKLVFEQALKEIAEYGDPVNKLLELKVAADKSVQITWFDLPSS